MSITIDIVEGAQLDNAVSGSTLKRVAYVDGLDVGNAPSSVLLKALIAAGLPQWYAQHPDNTRFVLNRQVVNPVTDGSCTVDLYYVSGPGTPAASTWLVTESTTLMSVTTQIHPATKQPINVLGDNNKNVAPQIATFQYDMSLLRLTFEGWIARSMVPGPSTPTQTNTAAFNQAVGSVNAAPWRGYDVGYWRFAEWDDSTQDRGFSFTIRAGFITKITEDWSSWAALRDPNSGRLIAPDPKDVTELRNTAYFYGPLYRKAITKAGLYPPTDFVSLFGT